MCRNLYCFAKSAKCLEVNCGPPSDQNVLGMPVWQQDACRAEVRRVDFAWFSIGTISGQFE